MLNYDMFAHNDTFVCLCDLLSTLKKATDAATALLDATRQLSHSVERVRARIGEWKYA